MALFYNVARMRRWKDFKGKRAPDGVRVGPAFGDWAMCECGIDQAVFKCGLCDEPEKFPITDEMRQMEDPERPLNLSNMPRSTDLMCYACYRMHCLCGHTQFQDERPMEARVAREWLDWFLAQRTLCDWACEQEKNGVEDALIHSAIYTAVTNGTEPVLPAVAAPEDQQARFMKQFDFIICVGVVCGPGDAMHDAVKRLLIEP